MEKEIRFYNTTIEFEERDGAKDDNVIIGHASVFNSDSEDFGGWIERVAPGAFDDVLSDDAFALFNHDPNMVLGRNKVNVELSQDKNGLRYRIKLPDTTLAKDLRLLIKEGIISKSSFGFTIREQRWEHFKEKPSIRTLVKIDRLYDVSPVTYPAYPNTSVAARCLKQEKDESVIDRSLYIQIQEAIFKSQTHNTLTQ